MTQSVQMCPDSRQRVLALVTAMAGMTEAAVDHAIAALLGNDAALAQAVVQKEKLINGMEMHIDAAVLEHFSHGSFSDEDGRFMACVLKINKDLERMGDLAANISRKVMEWGKSWEQSDRSELQPMAIAASHICRKALQAVARQDTLLAQSALDSEEAIHTYRDYAFRRIREKLGNETSETDSDLALLLASRHLDQIAGHAANVADHLIFWMRNKNREQLLA